MGSTTSTLLTVPMLVFGVLTGALRPKWSSLATRSSSWMAVPSGTGWHVHSCRRRRLEAHDLHARSWRHVVCLYITYGTVFGCHGGGQLYCVDPADGGYARVGNVLATETGRWPWMRWALPR